MTKTTTLKEEHQKTFLWMASLTVLTGSAAIWVVINAIFQDWITSLPIPKQAYRIISPAQQQQQQQQTELLKQTSMIHHLAVTESDRHVFMQTYGTKRCIPFARYQELPSNLQIEAWKYCNLYLGTANIYQEIDEIHWFIDYEDFVKPSKNTVLQLSEQPNAHHSSFIHLSQKSVAKQMLQVLEETPFNRYTEDPLLLPKALATFMDSILDNKTVLTSSCRSVSHGWSCSLESGYCCQIMSGKHVLGVLKDPIQPSQAARDGEVATITVKVTHNPRVTLSETPNFFDILLQNDCLPTQKQCHACLRKGGGCQDCHQDCPCYCQTLCNIRPPPKVISQIWTVHPPKYQRDPSRLIPRLVHQTWFEPVTSDKYPNMSRLIESWKTSGWDYTFYDDETAAAFLSQHFPPQVREAYDTILPGAFKADLFRYCVLLIKGGIYADMDVLLESNLDNVFAPDVGFMVPIDEPGIMVGHRSCLWNGLLGVAPGHPFLAKTIELVVNNIQNRFTSVDYDDMLCPTPILSVSHSVDTLFTCGPCILGAGMNQVLQRHAQTEWDLGEIDLWKAAPSTGPDDMRHSIPGKSVILSQNKNDMGAHRFTLLDKNLMVAATDMPDYDDRPPTKQHYSKTHEKVGVYGLRNLYKDNVKANELIQIEVANA